MRISKDGYLNRAFVLTPDDLIKLEEVIESFTTIRTIKISCADKADREFASITDLLKFENPPNKAINALRIITTSVDKNITTLWLRMDAYSMRNVSYSIEGEEDTVLNFMDKLEERLSAMRPWYALASDVGFRGMLPTSLVEIVTLWIVLNGGIRLAISKGILSDRPTSYTQLGIVTLIMGLVMLAILIAIKKLQKKYFPSGMFAIGQGAKRHKDNEIIRQTIIIGFILEIAGGLTLYLLL